MPHLVAVCGLPGVGKSTVAREIAAELDATLLQTDAIRKDVRADPRYDAEETRRVYADLLDEARAALEDGESVVLDATFRVTPYRAWVTDLGESLGVDPEFVKVRCDESVAVERIADRDDALSDASIGTYYEVMRSFEDLSVDHVTVDNSRSEAATRRQVAELCDQVFAD